MEDIETYFYYQDLRSNYRRAKAFRDIIGFTIISNHIISAIHSFLFYPGKDIEINFLPTYDGFKFEIIKHF